MREKAVKILLYSFSPLNQAKPGKDISHRENGKISVLVLLLSSWPPILTRKVGSGV